MTRTPQRKSSGPRPAVVLPFQPPKDAQLVRLGRVREAMKRVADGYYDREEVRDELVQKVLDEIQSD